MRTTTAIEIEHAVFTSNRSISGQGYRVVAWSPGVTVEEQQHLAKSSPSHNSMCDASDSAVALSFYNLRSGRHCVARTTHAGREQTGRGGQRVLTQSFVLTGEQLARFQNNPFSVLRALEAARGFVADHRLPRTLQPVHPSLALGARKNPSASVIASGFDAVGHQMMGFLLNHAIRAATVRERSPSLIAAGIEPAAIVVEALLLAMPVHLRSAFSFTIGLKFALSRRYRISMVGPDLAHTRRIIAGQGIQLLESADTNDVPAHEQSSWATMVLDCRNTGQLEALVALNGKWFDDAAPETLDHVARLRITLNHLEEFSIAELLTALEPVKPPPRSEIERQLELELTANADAVLSARLPVAPPEEVHSPCHRR